MPKETLTSFDALTMEQKERFLGDVLSQLSPEVFEAVLLQQRSKLLSMSNNGKVQLAFRMGISPVAHAYRPGGSGSLQWELPQVPEHLRPLVYETSRLIFECQSALGALVQGRGDFTRALGLLNPAAVQEMTNRFRTEMQEYTNQLRAASGRIRRNTAPAGSRKASEEPKPTTAPSPVSAPKPKRASSRSKAQVQPIDNASSESNDIAVPTATETGITGVESAEETSQYQVISENEVPEQQTEQTSNFGFDVLALTSGSDVKPESSESEE